MPEIEPEPLTCHYEVDTTSERCLWSNRRDSGTRGIKLESPSPFARWPEILQVCPCHEERFRRFYAYEQRYAGLLLGTYGFVVFAGLIFWALGAREQVVAGTAMLVFGVLIIVFPFATPQTVQMMGVRASVLLLWIAGAVLAGYGVFVLTASA